MATPTILRDDFFTIITPRYTLPRVRVFVFADQASVFRADQGRPVLHDRVRITSFAPSGTPRQAPHTLTTESGEEWTLQKGPCGCGSPLRQLNWRDAYDPELTNTNTNGESP